MRPYEDDGTVECQMEMRPPEQRLADLMLRECGHPFDPATLRAFILRHWSKVSALAHQIHDAPDPYALLQAGDG